MPLQKYTYNSITYYVDYRMSQFRSAVEYPKAIRFLDFDSDLGNRILSKMIRENVVDWTLLHI